MKILITLVAILAIIIAIGFVLPDSTHVSRTININSAPSTVFNLINNYQDFNRWSPWAKKDPDTKYTYTGPESGVGAKMSWDSENPKVGKGSQEIIISVPNTRIETALDFGSQGQAVAYFDIKETGNTTTVEWGFNTDHGMNPINRYFGLMLDGWVGKEYEAGLANLKVLAEGGS